MTTFSSVIRSATRGVAVMAALGMSLTVAGSPAAQGDRAHHTHHARFARTLVIDGHGYGHGHGMSQYGAEGPPCRE